MQHLFQHTFQALRQCDKDILRTNNTEGTLMCTVTLIDDITEHWRPWQAVDTETEQGLKQLVVTFTGVTQSFWHSIHYYGLGGAASGPNAAVKHNFLLPLLLGGGVNTGHQVALLCLLWQEVDAIDVVAGSCAVVFRPSDVVILQHSTGDQTHHGDLSRGNASFWEDVNFHLWWSPIWKINLGLHWDWATFVFIESLYQWRTSSVDSQILNYWSAVF